MDIKQHSFIILRRPALTHIMNLLLQVLCTVYCMSSHWLLSHKIIVKTTISKEQLVALRTGGRLFDPWLGQYSFLGLMIVIATGFIPLSPLSVVLTMVKWESS